MFDNSIFEWYTDEQIKYLAFWKKGLYKHVKIPKKDWWIRELKIPTYKLKVLQRRILDQILNYKSIVLIDNVTWFLENKSIIDNANYHIWKKYLLKIDIKDFFPSIWQDRVFGLFRSLFELEHDLCNYLSWICCKNNELPQWSPASPMLANLIARWIDYRIHWLLKTFNKNIEVNYSRYADDLCFSFNRKINFHKFVEIIIDIIISEWFYPNYNKIHLFSSWKKQVVTWIVVNEKLNYWRKKYNSMKALIYNIKKNWFEIEMKKWNRINNTNIWNVESFKSIVLWHLNFINQVSPEYYNNLQKYNIL